MTWFIEHLPQIFFVAGVTSSIFNFGKYIGKCEAVGRGRIETFTATYRVTKIKDKIQ